MAKKKKKETMQSAARGLVGTGVTLGAGSYAITKMPSTAATTHVQGGITGFAGMMPVMATATGAGLTLDQVRKMQHIQKKKRKRQRRYY